MIYPIFDLTLTLVAFELFEYFWQKGDSFRAYIGNLLSVYDKSLLLFISLHPSFYFMLYCIFVLKINSFLVFGIAVVKFFDIYTKIAFVKKLSNGEDLGEFEFMVREDVKLSKAIKLLPCLLYSLSFYIALSMLP